MDFGSDIPVPANEIERLKTLYEYDILDTLEEKEFDAITSLTSHICNTPVSMINLIDEDRQWTKSSYGIDIEEIPRGKSICQYAILYDEPLQIKDLRKDERFKDKDFVKKEPGFRYYAGAPLAMPDHYNIGALCVMDTEKNGLEEWQLQSLEILADEVIARLNLRLRQKELEKLNEQKEELLRVVNHDMRNPLTGIIGIADLIRLKEYENEDELNYLMGIIGQSTRRLLENVNEMLDVAQLESGVLELEPENKKLIEVVKNVMELQKPNARLKKIDLNWDVTSSKEQVILDPIRFSQILGNLVTYAIKFTPSGGSVEVTVAYPVRHDGIKNIMVEVKDTGIGIPEEFLPILFTKYGGYRRQGTAGEKSTGLGMALLKNLIDAHDGQIDVESEEGKGSNFTVLLAELEMKNENKL